MSKTGEIPYSWDQIEAGIEGSIMALASVIEAVGPKCDGKLVKMYLGISDEVYREMDFLDFGVIDITRHRLYDLIKTAYEYAYQVRAFDDLKPVYDIWYDIAKLLEGFVQTWMRPVGEPSPFHVWYDDPLRRMLDTFLARYFLFDEENGEPWDLTIRQLSLLANMTVPAVRTSLSKEGFKLEKSTEENRAGKVEFEFRLNPDDAKLWLSRRRGFIRQRTETVEERDQQTIDQILYDRDLGFPIVLNRIMKIRRINTTEIIATAGLDVEWLSNLINDQAVAVDVEALRAIANILDIPAPDFAAAGVRYILMKEGC